MSDAAGFVLGLAITFGAILYMLIDTARILGASDDGNDNQTKPPDPDAE